MAWDLDDVMLALVDSVVLLLLPATRRSITSLGYSTEYSLTPAKQTPFYGSSLSSRYVSLEFGTSRSLITSL